DSHWTQHWTQTQHNGPQRAATATVDGGAGRPEIPNATSCDRTRCDDGGTIKRQVSRRRLISKRAKLAERWLRVTYRALIGKDFQARRRGGHTFFYEFTGTEPVIRALRRHSGLRSRARREVPVENLRARPVQHALESSRMIVDRFQIFDAVRLSADIGMDRNGHDLGAIFSLGIKPIEL